ncbi:MAG: class I SAM-dependent methyltransferase [Deltaproteobacteria bacterium]|nr:class I SAM-dependent methyltransferase [Deltaproteobacteria bacterium]
MQTQNYDRYVTSHLGFVQKENHEIMSRYFAKNYLRHLGKKTSQVLEIGCGLGSFLYFLQQYGFVNYSAIDLSEECVSSCIDMGLGSQANLERADAFDFLKNSPKKFDVIVMNDVIEHIEKEKIVEMLKLIYVSLADGGRLIIKVVNSSNPVTGASSRYIDFTHTICFTQESLSQVLRLGGFSSFQVLPQDIWVFNPIVNGIGKLLQGGVNLLFRGLFLLYGRKSTTIFTKDIIVVAQKQ